MSKRVCWYTRQLALTMLWTSGSFAIASPLLGQTAPGTVIRNVFTGTYDGAPPEGVVSNEVNLVISEVAGITVQANTPTILGSDARLDPGDPVEIDFVIRNVGNDPTRVFIPDIARASGPNVGSFTLGRPRIVAFNGTDLQNPVEIASGGQSTGAIAALPNGGALPINGTVVVRVVATPIPGVAQQNHQVRISLGNTTTADAQNVSYGSNEGSVHTIDNPGIENGDTAGAPINGEREAMDGADLVVGATFQAFAQVLLAQTYDKNQTPAVIRDDRIEYCLAVKVAATLAEAGFTPNAGETVLASDLNPTAIALDGQTVERVLVADAVPTGMQLAELLPEVPTTGNWQAVYTTSPLATRADRAAWTTTRPSDLATVTRMGFVSDVALAKGSTTESCLKFGVVPRSDFPGGRIENIAQLVGQSQPGTVIPGSPTQLVYDESGDQTFNNGLARTNPDPTTTGGIAPDNGGMTDGVSSTATDGVDPGRGTDARNPDTNQGNDGPVAPSRGTKTLGGETLALNLVPAPVNGPINRPAAVGPQNDNDDFTNKVIVPPAAIAPGTPLNDEQTPAVSFTNTINNPTTAPQIVMLLPTAPSTPTALPDGTRVTITNPATGQSAIYTYTSATGFTFVSGNNTSSSQPVQLEIPAGTQANYQVAIDLPSAQPLRDYPVPILGFVDQGEPGLDLEDPANTTINRIYTGFIRVSKEARILEADGEREVVPFTTDQTLLGPASETDRIVEYRITYTNLSTSQAGGLDNVTLPAMQFVLTEDGTEGTNNWFTLTNDPNFPTNSSAGSAVATLGAVTITPEAGDIKVYTVSIDNLQPGQTGVLTFRRRIVD